MGNLNIFALFNQYDEQSKKANSLENGEIEARDYCLDICDCCNTGCLCTAVCVDCFT